MLWWWVWIACFVFICLVFVMHMATTHREVKEMPNYVQSSTVAHFAVDWRDHTCPHSSLTHGLWLRATGCQKPIPILCIDVVQALTALVLRKNLDWSMMTPWCANYKETPNLSSTAITDWKIKHVWCFLTTCLRIFTSTVFA